MSETDFAREHAERREAERFELEKMRERNGLALSLARLQLTGLMRQRAFHLCLQADSIAKAIIGARRKRSHR